MRRGLQSDPCEGPPKLATVEVPSCFASIFCGRFFPKLFLEYAYSERRAQEPG